MESIFNKIIKALFSGPIAQNSSLFKGVTGWVGSSSIGRNIAESDKPEK